MIRVGHPQPALDAAPNQLLVRHQHLPRRAVPPRAGRSHRLAHRPEQRVGELVLAAVAAQPDDLGRRHIAAHGLAVRPGQQGDRSQALTRQPQRQHLTDLTVVPFLDGISWWTPDTGR